MLSRDNMILCCYLMAFMDLFAVGMLIPLFSRRGRELGASPSLMGVIGSIYGGLQFLSGPYMGKVSDKWGRKPVLILSFIGCLVGYFLGGISESLVFFAIARIPLGILKHSQASVKAYLSDITFPEERAGTVGNLNACGSLGFIIAPIIGGTVAMQENGFFKVSLLTSLIYVAGLVFVWFVFDNQRIAKEKGIAASASIVGTTEIVDKSDFHRHSMESSEGTKHKAKQTVFTFLKVVSIQNVLDLLFIRFIMSFSMLIYRSNYTSMLDYRYHVDAKTAGYIISYGSIIGMISGLSAGKIYHMFKSDQKIMRFCTMLMIASLVGIALSPNIYGILFFVAPLCLSTSIMRVVSHNVLLNRIRPDEKGAVMGIADSMTSIARMMSPAVAGIVQEYSVSGPCWLATGLAVVGIGFMLIFSPYKGVTDKDKKVA